MSQSLRNLCRPWMLTAAAALAVLAVAGCRCPAGPGPECPMTPERPAGFVSPATRAELAEARTARDKYQSLFEQAATVAEAKAAEAEVVRIDSRIRDLEARAATERRAHHGPRTIYYGPLGFVFKLTELVLQKLYIVGVR